MTHALKDVYHLKKLNSYVKITTQDKHSYQLGILTTEAKNATVDMMGLPALLKGMG